MQLITQAALRPYSCFNAFTYLLNYLIGMIYNTFGILLYPILPFLYNFYIIIILTIIHFYTKYYKFSSIFFTIVIINWIKVTLTRQTNNSINILLELKNFSINSYFTIVFIPSFFRVAASKNMLVLNSLSRLEVMMLRVKGVINNASCCDELMTWSKRVPKARTELACLYCDTGRLYLKPLLFNVRPPT